jgi:heparinase II/III-like protein/alginate lyase
MVTADRLAERKIAIAGSRDLTALREHLVRRAAPLLERMPALPEHKALLSMDGGVCPTDGAALLFDPWSPGSHCCPRCRETYAGLRPDRHAARYQHLWLAERTAHLAALGALDDLAPATARAREILQAYAARYLRYPNRDNVLGPSRLFFSTYLESLWICNVLAAAMLLRESDNLDEATTRAVNQLADEAANLIGEFDEGFSNRQTWNNAALAAIAVWFEDEDLAGRAIQSPTGLLAHLMRGFGRDGMWYEGENYHLFALQGLLSGVAWAAQAGIDVWAEPQLDERVREALLAPARSALPDGTFPARKDSRFGVSLAQPMYLELWEIGLAKLGMREAGGGMGDAGSEMREIASWLATLYQTPAPAPELFDSYLHDAPIASRIPHPASRTRHLASRITLSWWALLEMLPELPPDAPPWSPDSVLLDAQGLAILRAGGRYVSLECGPSGGGHGHPDRLHLTLHANGAHWLPDLGTGSYVAPDLFWYRSTLAHNAPRLDGRSQPAGDARCVAFDARGGWAWARGHYGELTRAVASGPAYLVDVADLEATEAHLIELPWHFGGAGDVVTPGRWTEGELADEFVSDVARFVPDGDAPVVLELTADGRRLRAHFVFAGELLRATGPGTPGSGKRETFYAVRSRGRGARFVTVLEPVTDSPAVRAVRVRGDVVEVETTRGIERHAIGEESWEVQAGAERVRLAGARPPEPALQPLFELERPTQATGSALRIDRPPALDGSLDGFDQAEPLRLDLEDQYRRSEEPYAGAEEFSATAYVNWDDEALYLAVEVTKPDVCFRPADAPPLRLDNEPDDIHSDGVQVYLNLADGGAVAGFLMVPEVPNGGGGGGQLRVRGAGGTSGGPEMARGAWRRTDAGYCVTVALASPDWSRSRVGGRIGFDLIINEMLPGRERRAGQLVWSGGNGWVWLRGDRQEPERFGVLELVG